MEALCCKSFSELTTLEVDGGGWVGGLGGW